MPSSTISRGNLLNEVLIAVTLTPSSVAALSSGTQTFALPGSLTTDFIETFPAAAGTANMLIQNCWVSSAGIVAIYTFTGGLTSAIYNEVLQFFLIVLGIAPLVFI